MRIDTGATTMLNIVPTSLKLDVNRLCSTGEKNACSMLYPAAALAAKSVPGGHPAKPNDREAR